MVFRYFGFIFEIVGRKIGIPRIIALLKLFAFPSGVKWRALTSKRGERKTFFFFFTPPPTRISICFEIFHVWNSSWNRWTFVYFYKLGFILLLLFFWNPYKVSLFYYFNTNLDFLELCFENTFFFLLKKRILILYLKITVKNCIFFFFWKLIFRNNPELTLYFVSNDKLKRLLKLYTDFQ